MPAQGAQRTVTRGYSAAKPLSLAEWCSLAGASFKVTKWLSSQGHPFNILGLCQSVPPATSPPQPPAGRPCTPRAPSRGRVDFCSPQPSVLFPQYRMPRFPEFRPTRARGGQLAPGDTVSGQQRPPPPSGSQPYTDSLGKRNDKIYFTQKNAQ